MISLEGHNILIVDDELDVREMLRDAFEDVGCKVFEAEGGEEAFELTQKEDIHCIVSDLRMPKGSGIDLVKNIKSKIPNLPVYLISGFSDYTGNEIAALGAEAIIFKPFDVDEVVETVHARLQEVSS